MRLPVRVALSLRFKWIATLILTSVMGIILVGVIVNVTTLREFDRLILEQSQERIAVFATNFYALNGSWEGIESVINQDGNQGGKGPNRRGGGRGQGGGGGWENNNGGNPPLVDLNAEGFPFILVDTDGQAIFKAASFETGDLVPERRITSATDIVVDNVVIARLVSVGGAPVLDVREQVYVSQTNRALVGGVIGAVLVSALVGLLLSRTFLRPLRELTSAVTAMKQGALEQRVTVRTRDELGALATAFNDMSAQIARANHLRRQMTADIAHDLRTPLTVITGYLEGMRDGTLKPTLPRFETMYSEAIQLQRLIDDLRTLSLADAGELPLMRSAVDARDLLEQVKAAFDPAAAEKGIALALDIPLTPIPSAHIDRERMTQVLANLVTNALRYAKGNITLRASSHPTMVQITVEDDGVGIAADKLPFIFERFYRADDSRSAPTIGQSGLGLAIARSIVEAHGGAIHAASRLNQGTIISIQLPLAS